MITAIILAAGRSTRMGKPKQTLPVRGEPMLQRVLGIFRKSKVDKIVVVLGANEQEVRRTVKFENELVVSNQAYAEGMGGSLRVGLDAVGHDADAVVIALADQPFLMASTVNKIIEEHSHTKVPIVVPVYNGRRGNPVLFDKSLFAQIKKIRGDFGAKSILENEKDAVLEVPVNDEGVIVDLDTPKDYQDAVSA